MLAASLRRLPVRHSTGVHSIRTRSPGWLAVWQLTLAGRSGDAVGGDTTGAAAAAGITTAAGTIAGAGVTGRARDDANCGTGTAGFGFGGFRSSGAAACCSTGSTAGSGSCAVMTTGGGCSGDERQGVHELSRVKASMVGRVIVSAVGIDCMQPESATPKKHTAARFGIDSIFAAPAVD
jgi:hypothetical protein